MSSRVAVVAVAGVAGELHARASCCSRAHQSLLTLLPSIWWPAVAAPHRKCSGKVVIFGPFGMVWCSGQFVGRESGRGMPQAAAVRGTRPGPAAAAVPSGNTMRAVVAAGMSAEMWISPSSMRHSTRMVPCGVSCEPRAQRERGPRDRLDHDGFPRHGARRLAQPEGVGVQEADHRALAVVVERLVRDAVLVDAVPVLPDRGRAAVDHVQPRRCRALEEQLVRDVGVAGVGEHRQQVGRWRGTRCPGACRRQRMSSTRRAAAASLSSSGMRPNDSART